MATKESPTPANGPQNDGGLLDPVNRRLLALLGDDARTSVAELARQVSMSAPAVRERLGRLEQAGVIRGYRVDVDPAAIGLPVAAWCGCGPVRGSCRISRTWPGGRLRSASATA